uniref:Endolytic murein transglycosylase n=1 Tax=Candidatus Kentrum sp. FW TaxID=2126338 RepID=A0A450SGY3_9GAMM|nr:MAG: UPF0755 protein [Candidatus Kentron sp. FW]
MHRNHLRLVGLVRRFFRNFAQTLVSVGRRRVLIIGGVLLLTAGAVGWLISEHTRWLEAPLHIGDEAILLVVKPGMSLRAIAMDLSERNVLPHPTYLVWEAIRRGIADQIKVGEYRLVSGLTPQGLLDALVRGKVLQRTLTIIEGWNFKDLMRTIRTNEYLTHTLEEKLTDEAIMERIGFPGHHPEGRFYPDTYYFPLGTPDVTFLERAYLTMERKLAEAWKQRAKNLPYRNPSEALTLASIIEKETGKPEERTHIAGVFVHRLRRGMRLQSDPTVIYGLGESFTGDLRYSHLRKPTPYNTYTEDGIPPTPIAMPGGAAIHAALHPAATKDLFFVAKGDGTHEFSATYEEHKRAVARYRLYQKQAKK